MRPLFESQGHYNLVVFYDCIVHLENSVSLVCSLFLGLRLEEWDVGSH